MAGSSLTFNGINGETGDYLLDPLTPEQIARLALGEPIDPEHQAELQERHERPTRAFLGVVEGIDPQNLTEAGWGVLFAFEDRKQVAQIKAALQPLLDLRREQAGGAYDEGGRYREFVDGYGFRPGDGKAQFLARHGLGPGPVDPAIMPYYLLIVGNPETIPYRFQYQLDVQFAVGRLYFDTPEEYANYAQSVVAAETGQVRLPRTLTMFGVHNTDDPATALSATNLVRPLHTKLTESQPGWTVRTLLADAATKAQLGRLLGGDETPALLFTASHGMGFPHASQRQLPHQGALLCQDWPGPQAWRQPIPPDHYFSADDVYANARLLGSIAFHFACYSAGTPRLDDFGHLRMLPQQETIAPHAFVARLPRALLAHPKGGALAVLGHVERAWGYSFNWGRAGAQTAVFEAALNHLMAGKRVGSALEYFNERYAELSSDLTVQLEDLKFQVPVDERELAGLWTANNDARSYVIVGDPAVRLPLGENGSSAGRPALAAIALPVAPAPRQAENHAEIAATYDTEEPESTRATFDAAPVPDTSPSFLPPIPPQPDLMAADPQLYEYWREHIHEGFQRNNRMFSSVLDAFMVPYHTTIWLYRILFGVGVLSFLAAAALGAWLRDPLFALIFGGLSVISFLSYFLGRPLQALEENLKFITWLGIVYNTYWTRLAYMMNIDTIHDDLEDATQDAVNDIERLLDKHQEFSRRRPGLR